MKCMADMPGKRLAVLGLGLLLLFLSFAHPSQSPGQTAQQMESNASCSTKPEAAAGRLELSTSDAKLEAAFAWARHQALAYAFDGDPVGKWYEAALPGRQAFCMRDVSHQSMGAHALGLADYTHNMLEKFAENISDSKDWCSYWEINRDGLPAPVDYHDTAEFWYNLPANFDVLDTCYRMYIWTGDSRYVSDPVFVNFYRRTVHDYVSRWDLSADRIMTRQRLLNVRGHLDASHRFQVNRGIPSYNEQDKDFVVGIDQIAAQYAGYMAYARFAELRGEDQEAAEFLKHADEMKTLLNGSWWDKEAGGYYSKVDLNHKLAGHGANLAVLYYGAAEDGPKSASVVNAILQNIAAKKPAGIEGQSHLAEVLYKYGKPEAAYDQMIDIASEGKNRHEYPEASYSVIGAITTGLMGIELEAAEPGRSLKDGSYVDRTITTLSNLTQSTKWAELSHLPVRNNEISVRHDGLTQTTLTNVSGPSLRWQACFQGSHSKLVLEGKPVNATITTRTRTGQPISCAMVFVGAGERKLVQAGD